MSTRTRLALLLLRWMTDDERRDVEEQLLDGDLDAHASRNDAEGESAASVDAQDEAGPDWPRVWQGLLDASVAARRVKTRLASAGTFFDFSDLAQETDNLIERINDTYALMCRVPRLNGLHMEAGEDIRSLRRRYNVRRADALDEELSTIHGPAQILDTAAGPEAWSIDYRDHGGFLATRVPATAGDTQEPWKFWGTAPTPQSAAHALRWYFHSRSTDVAFSPPVPPSPREITPFTVAADLSLEGPRVPELLARRGDIYGQHVVACQAAREQLTEHNTASYLAGRAAQLNIEDPQYPVRDALRTQTDSANDDHAGFIHTVQWVESRLVVSTGHPIWGDFDGFRDDAIERIVAGLLSSDVDVFTSRLFGDPINLVRAPGWVGPLYSVGSNGNHRIHAARVLGLPWLAATVDAESIAPSYDMADLVTGDHDHDQIDTRPFRARLDERAALVQGLIRRGVIDGDFDPDDDILRCRRLPASWLLRAPRLATLANAVYQSRYPGAVEELGISAAVATDPEAWTSWLISAGG